MDKHVTVLLINDDPSKIEAWRDAILAKSNNVHVVAATTFEDAGKILQGGEMPGLMVSDLVMSPKAGEAPETQTEQLAISRQFIRNAASRGIMCAVASSCGSDFGHDRIETIDNDRVSVAEWVDFEADALIKQGKPVHSPLSTSPGTSRLVEHERMLVRHDRKRVDPKELGGHREDDDYWRGR